MKNQTAIEADQLSKPYLALVRKIVTDPEQLRYEFDLLDLDIEDVRIALRGMLVDEACIDRVRRATHGWIRRNPDHPAATEFRKGIRDSGAGLPATWGELPIIDDLKVDGE